MTQDENLLDNWFRDLQKTIILNLIHVAMIAYQNKPDGTPNETIEKKNQKNIHEYKRLEYLCRIIIDTACERGN